MRLLWTGMYGDQVSILHERREHSTGKERLEKVDGVLKLNLKTNHPYFYQVQTQMLVSGMDYCEFIVWT